MSAMSARLTPALEALVSAIARHWLLLSNIALGLVAVLPFAPPVLLRSGQSWLANLGYLIYRPLCHQLPERSFFLFGRQPLYTLRELQFLVGPDVPLRYTGDAVVGWKVAVCERDVAVYGVMFLAGLAFALLRRHLRPLALRSFALLCAPMAIDGVGQLLLLWDSTWWSRVITGGLFGLACIWLAFPYVERGMQQVRTDTEPNRT